ncbi:hypothetical protein [Neolewinella litorea]|uniref:hypothetical protein n=1 Tax=Neolewinella litorea TaxID=2562452 RepID=UPI001455FD4E|nr:hypothetical protein [Neolewinella litorea]
MKHLTESDVSMISGGESPWYWIAYAAGWVCKEIEEDLERLSQPAAYEWSPARPYG